MSIESVIPSNHLILCHHFLLLSSIFPIIRVFSNESVIRIRWRKYSASTSVFPVNIQDGIPLGLTDWISLQSKGHLRVFSSTTVRRHQFFGAQPLDTLTSVYDYWILIQLMQGEFKLPIFCQILNFDKEFLFENLAITYLLSYTHKIYKGKLEAATQFVSI